MLTPLILFLGLTVATAVIAHWSDNLGKKLGKKRVSLFGLRPRTTATILTISSSWVIMLVTLVVLLTAVPQLRRALFSYDRDRQKAQEQIETARELLNTTRGQLVDTDAKFDKARNNLKRAASNLKTSQSALKAAQEAEKQGLVRAKTAQYGEKQARQGERAAQEGAKRARREVSAAQKQVLEAQKQFQEAQKQFQEAQKREKIAQRETKNAQRETKKVRQLTARSNQQLNISRTKLRTTQSGLKTVESNLKIAKRKLYKSDKELLLAGRDLFVARRRLAEARTLTARRLFNEAPIKARQTFAARVIPASQTPTAVAVQLREMLKQARENFAESEDITPTFPPDAKLQLLKLTERDENGKSTDLQGEVLLQFLARRIAGQTTSVRLVAPINYLADETEIGLIFVPVPLAPAFSDEEILASATIDGAQGDARIFRSLLDLLDLGQREAEKRGVNPPQSPDEPNFYAEGTNVRLFAALRRIEGSKARLSVNLKAAKALSTVEPLQIVFEIEGDLGASTSGVFNG